MQPTYLDIQKLTGLSLSTISKYMNGGNVRPATKTAIDKAVKQLDYRINDYARGLRSRCSKTIGLLIPELESTFNTSVMGHVVRILRQEGYACVICSCDKDKAIEEESVDFLLSKMVDGIITIPFDKTGRHLKQIDERNIPIVLIDRPMTEIKTDMVTIDNVGAGELAAAYLYENGHRDIGVISGPQGIYTMAGRKKGFIDYLKQGNCLKEELVIDTEFSIGGGYEAALSLLSHAETEKKPPTALFCTNYEITLGTVAAINTKGIKYPEDISILGFDNMFLSDIIRPRLSMIAQPIEAMAESAAKLMLDKLINESTGIHHIELPVTLIKGDSVKNLNKEA